MQVCLYTEASAAERTELLRRLHTVPALGALGSIGLTYTLNISSDYPAQALISALTAAGLLCTDSMKIDENLRYLSLGAVRDEDTAYLLRAAGISADVMRQPIVTLYGISDAQFLDVRDTLLTSTEVNPLCTFSPPLPDDAADGFLVLTDTERVARAKTIGLALPDICLDVIAAHYRRAGRNPLPEELRMLDTAYRDTCTNPAVCAPIALYTDDSRIQSLYADLMEKRRAIVPNASAPATLSELTYTATRYLCALRKHPLPLSRRICCAPDESEIELAAVGANAIGGYRSADHMVECLLTNAPYALTPPLPDDRLLFVSSASGNFAAELHRFFASAASYVRQSTYVRAGQLISAVAQVLGNTGYGIRIFPSESETCSPTERLLNPRSGVLLVCAGNAGAIVPTALSNAGLRYTVLAAVTQQNTVTTGVDGNGIFFPAAMLAPRPTVTAEIHAPIPATANVTGSPLSRLITELASPTAQATKGLSPLLAERVAQTGASVQVCDRELVSAVCCRPTNDPLQEVRDAALDLVARLISAGAKLEQITLSLSAELPMQNPLAVGQSLAALLGLYWVQIELGIVSERPHLMPSSRLCIRLAATAPKANNCALPYAAQKLYLLSPVSDTGRLNGEYTLLRYVADLHQAQHIFTAPLSGLTPTAAAVLAADQNALGLHLTETIEITTPAGILVAADMAPTPPAEITVCTIGQFTANRGVSSADEQLDYNHLTSAICGTLPAPIPNTPAALLPPQPSKRRVARPRILIPTLSPRADADIYKGLISAHGGEAVILPLDFSTPETMRCAISDWADLLEEVQIVLLKESRTVTEILLSHRRSAEAITRFIDGDGLLAACGGAFSAMLARGLLLPEHQTINARQLIGLSQLTIQTISTASPWMRNQTCGEQNNILLTTPPVCPDLSPELYRAMIENDCILSVAAGTPDGRPAITAMATANGNLLAQSLPIAENQLASAIAYFA